MNSYKNEFLKTRLCPLISNLQATQHGNWGLMNAQQMAEHLTAFFKISTGRLVFPLVSAPEQLPKLREFLWSDKAFRENTKGPESIIPAEPVPVFHASMEIAIAKLDKEIQLFFDLFEKDPAKKTMHPVFGELNFDDWVQLHYKHVAHHTRQFGLICT